ETPRYDEDIFPTLELFGRVGLLKRWDAAVRLASPYPLISSPTTIMLDNRIQLSEGNLTSPDISGGLSLGYSHLTTDVPNVFAGHEKRKYRLYFADFPLAVSYSFSKFFTLYGGGMVSWYNFSGNQNNGENKEGDTYSLSTFLGTSLSLWRIELMPEIALSTVRKETDPNKGTTKVFFFPGLALAFNF
ncbi:MAG: hypothetical protein HYY62_04210, partial [Deltaproteobacteria bacterium]|nr:hypothetical protein [Deltaproteobacteria bacterium]